MDLLTAVSLRRLRVFLTVCETLHIARAAERLNVAQPALSQQIRALEEALGVRLFHRRKRGIDLTAAGRACRIEAEKLLISHTSAVDAVRRTARGEAGRIAIGYVASAMFEQRFPAQLRAMRERFPDVDLALREGNIAALLSALTTGDMDVALVRSPISIDPPLRSMLHSEQRLMVILPRDHRLAGVQEIPTALIAGEPMVGFPDLVDVSIMRTATDLALAAGVELNIAWRVSEIGSVLGLVAAGLGYGIVPESIARLMGPEIAIRPLGDTNARTELQMVWHGDRESPTLSRFLAIIAQHGR